MVTSSFAWEILRRFAPQDDMLKVPQNDMLKAPLYVSVIPNEYEESSFHFKSPQGALGKPLMEIIFNY